ncbi:hypothetical protein OS189_15955 [Sulfitobacter sp. F26169L]|uniref:hypothetical protein n=1 Tax=Sulfitobacter sp. F26169L TaxID=2996015 RepID=UPI002260FEB6|nr:hypothetical protein [Sulfitobacter sp. F26169L]MCX7567839.1 hypothetical protein [Sulfitobacter sp. F26169L]
MTSPAFFICNDHFVRQSSTIFHDDLDLAPFNAIERSTPNDAECDRMRKHMWMISLVCFGALVVISLLEETRLIGPFNGDRDLAARATLALVTLLGGTAFAFIQPAMWRTYARLLQRLIVQGGAGSKLAAYITDTKFNIHIYRAAICLCISFSPQVAA